MGEPPSRSRELTGRVVAGRYQIERLIGAGGMGEVYLALDRRISRPVALKQVRDRDRFDREARITAQISHPNIVVVHDSGVDDDVNYIVMELLEGQTLRDYLQRRRDEHDEMRWDESIEIITVVAAALRCVHEHNVVHRDLKPSNIYMVDDSAATIKLLDFGLARDLGRPDEAVTASRVIVGTTPYLAPEQLAEKPASSCESDLHALGVVWWEMLAGRNPFIAATDHETSLNVVRVTPERVGDVMRDIPPEVSDVVARLLNKEPTQRGSDDDLHADLVRLARLAGQTPSRVRDRSSTADATRVQPPRPSSSSQRRPPLWASPIPRAVISVALVLSFAILARGVLAATETPKPHVALSMPMDGAKALVPLEPLREEPDPRLVALGRELFHDTALSPNRDIACATCHPLADGAMTPEPQTHRGEDHTAAPWNISSLWNAPLMYAYSWKGDTSFADIVERASTKSFLMGNGTIDALTKRIAPLYADKFAAVGVPLDKQGLGTVFEAYLRHIEPRGDRADTFFAGNDKALGDLERQGAKDFEDFGCTACHQGRGLGGNMIAKFGVMVDDPYRDRHKCDDGSYCRSDADCKISGGGTCTNPPGPPRDQDLGVKPAHKGDPPTYRFRVPSLRNVGLTEPYFHDGSARTLDEAVRTMGKLQLGRDLEEHDVRAIEAFLRTLTADWSRAEQAEIDKLQAQKRGKQ